VFFAELSAHRDELKQDKHKETPRRAAGRVNEETKEGEGEA